MKWYLFGILIIIIVCSIILAPRQESGPLLQDNREVTEYGDTIIRNGDGTISIPCGNGSFVSMTEEHYWASRKKMKEYNELHRNDPPKKNIKVIRITQRVSASAWVDAGDLRSDPYDETEITTDIVIDGNNN